MLHIHGRSANPRELPSTEYQIQILTDLWINEFCPITKFAQQTIINCDSMNKLFLQIYWPAERQKQRPPSWSNSTELAVKTSDTVCSWVQHSIGMWIWISGNAEQHPSLKNTFLKSGQDTSMCHDLYYLGFICSSLVIVCACIQIQKVNKQRRSQIWSRNLLLIRSHSDKMMQGRKELVCADWTPMGGRIDSSYL